MSNDNKFKILVNEIIKLKNMVLPLRDIEADDELMSIPTRSPIDEPARLAAIEAMERLGTDLRKGYEISNSRWSYFYRTIKAYLESEK